MRFEDNRTAKKIMRKRINIIDQIITKKVLKKYEKTSYRGYCPDSCVNIR